MVRRQQQQPHWDQTSHLHRPTAECSCGSGIAAVSGVPAQNIVQGGVTAIGAIAEWQQMSLEEQV